MKAEDVTQFRSPTMRAAFLSLDRPEFLYAVKEVSRGMAEPTHGDWNRLQRISNFILMHPRLAQKFQWQLVPARQRLRVLRSDEEEHVQLRGHDWEDTVSAPPSAITSSTAEPNSARYVLLRHRPLD